MGAGGRTRAAVSAAAVTLALMPCTSYAGLQTDATEVGASAQESAEVSCSGNKHITGGGVTGSLSLDTLRIVSASPADGDDPNNKPDDLYRVVADNLSGTPATVTAYGYCSKGKFDYRKRITEPVTSGALRGSASCPRHSSVVGGGIATSGSFAQTWIGPSFPSASGPKDSWDGVFTDVEPDPGSFTATFTVVCSERWRVKLRNGDESPIIAGSFGNDSSECNSGEKVIGGGLTGDTPLVWMAMSFPANPIAWSVRLENESAETVDVQSRAICRR